MQFITGSVTAAKAVKEDAEYSKVTDTTHKTTLEAKLTAAAGFLTEDSKLANLNADGTLATTQSDLESAKTDLDAAVAAVKPELDFQKTKTSATAKVTELESLVNTALKTELERQVNELTKDRAAQATTMLENLTSLKESLESLQDLVSKGLAMQVDYPQKYYDADNKADFDAALLKASSVFPAFKWTTDSIVVPAPIDGALPNPRAWTKARDKSEFVLQNFVMAPAQTAPAAQSDSAATAAASATVRLANGEAASGEAQTTPAPASMADLVSTVSYLKSLNDSLKAEIDKLNGDTTENKTAYYKVDADRTLYWDGFMPRIVVEDYQPTSHGRNKENDETTNQNQEKIQNWFNAHANWEKLSEQLTKKLGADKFKNVTLSSPKVTYETISTGSEVKIPKVTFTVTAKNGYNLIAPKGDAKQISLSIRVLYTSASSTENALRYQGVSFSAAPSGANTADHVQTIKNVNVYLNYAGPAIVLDQDLPTVGTANNTSLNRTSNITGDFNTKFKELLINNLMPREFLSTVINYVNKFDPKFRAQLVTDTNGVAITRVQKDRNQIDRELRIGNLNDLLYNKKVFLQQVNGDSSAVYFAVNGVTSEDWLNTFLIRIPLTKFVKPVTAFMPAAPTAPAQPQGGQTETSQPAQTTGQSSDLTEAAA
ncbi:hypothetical protein ACJOMT_03565 [Mycoplasmopsis synoviae]|uniref:hypothetical protein n=2 Tax=Mycoplasmopsis synoviae TaxID=2109 RepID=UPI000CA0FBBF|nr:hypothetical protein [Mycoplasmopsis synoviae]AQT41466.1 putative phase-variable hemagglutinin [Mycoplasmopsis synoviae]AWL84045.1 hypothetical protein MSH_01195 [Mycoplasmopsis synoviae]UZF64538.1 hypothetical protein N0B76_01210 [Mycoplasmopsis synoviae]UZF65209.1 hypothetical protein N0B75_01215 [Mycoplasmopsis synoviae]UZF65883.1 hypothetical protein N0B74_01220 [Mycoplasmopsis synoviae]